MNRKPVIIDVDTGVDDAIALLVAFQLPQLDIRALTTVAGNVSLDKTTYNTRRLVELIGKDAFAMCRSLEAIYIPASVTTIAPGCFDDCAALVYLFYEGDFESWNALYSDFINPFTTAICLDGNYYQGADA